jgi:hypothetical protein
MRACHLGPHTQAAVLLCLRKELASLLFVKRTAANNFDTLPAIVRMVSCLCCILPASGEGAGRLCRKGERLL